MTEYPRNSPTESLSETPKSNVFERLTPELLETNFKNWKEKLIIDIEAKYPDHKQRDAALQHAKEFINGLPLYNCMKLGGVPFFADNPTLLCNKDLRLQVEEVSRIAAIGTNDDDRKYGRDNFLFLTYGQATFGGDDRLVVGIDPAILDRQGVLVALEDLSLMRFRKYNQNGSSLSWDEAWELQKNEIFTGHDFNELFPYFLTASFDDPSDYLTKPLSHTYFGLNKNDHADEKTRIGTFEVMVPGTIENSHIMFLGLGSESGVYEPIDGLNDAIKRLKKPIVILPRDDRGDNLSNLLNKRYQNMIEV